MNAIKRTRGYLETGEIETTPKGLDGGVESKPAVFELDFEQVPDAAKKKIDVMLENAKVQSQVARGMMELFGLQEKIIRWFIKEVILKEMKAGADANGKIGLFDVLAIVQNDPVFAKVPTMKIASYVSEMWDHIIDRLNKAD